MTLWAVPAYAAAAYNAIALLACAARRKTGPQPLPRAPVSILKPLHGADPRLFEALRSHAQQEYPEFEILFGVSDPADPALQEVERLRAAYPAVAIAAHVVPTSAHNAKVGVLAGLAKRARHAVLLVNDADIAVPPHYLRDVLAPLAGECIGLVTCLYRASAESFPARMEALGIATEFAPSVLVARFLGVGSFALGSTMALRKETLDAIGGFESIADYLADDYQLGRRVNRLGLRIHMAGAVVETALGAQTWAQVWRHQLRWSRTIRVSNPAGYYGYVVTQATLWAIVAFAAGDIAAGVTALALRIASGICVGRGVLKDRNTARLFPLIPLRDLFGFAVWAAGLFGSTVWWRNRRLRLRRDGRLIS